MSEIKRKRYPSDRLKLHELLEKKEKELTALEDEVKELRDRVRQADFTAIKATAEMYSVTPEQFAEIMQSLRSGQAQAVPPLPAGVTAVLAPDGPGAPEEEEIITDDEEI